MTIYILGSNGMLGWYLTKYLSDKFDVVPLTRNNFNIKPGCNLTELSSNMIPGDLVINAAGVIKPQIDVNNPINAIYVNAMFPHELANHLKTVGVKLIHVTTDCVFSGSKYTPYNETDLHDPTDVYGKTKSLGEPNNCTVIRTSIIGEEAINKRSFVEWVKSSAGKKASGYVNHYWNGITCLQFAKVVEQIINVDGFWNGVKHIYSPHIVTKYDMIRIVSDVYNLNIDLHELEAQESINRTLTTTFPDNLRLFKIPKLENQVEEMYEFGI